MMTGLIGPSHDRMSDDPVSQACQPSPSRLARRARVHPARSRVVHLSGTVAYPRYTSSRATPMGSTEGGRTSIDHRDPGGACSPPSSLRLVSQLVSGHRGSDPLREKVGPHPLTEGMSTDGWPFLPGGPLRFSAI
jgi:hypothetical protein